MKKDKTNYNYVVLFYDIGEERVNKVFKICKKYLTHYQKSVFRGEITPSNILKIKNELKRIIDEDKDTISILKMKNSQMFMEDVLGTRKTDEDIFL